MANRKNNKKRNKEYAIYRQPITAGRYKVNKNGKPICRLYL